MKRKLFLITFILVVFSTLTFAQKITVSGTVTSASDELSLPGASVVLKGTTIGTVTDFDGKYSLTIDGEESPVLVYSYIGYTNKEVSVNNQSIVDVALEPDISDLDEVVVIGYGVQKKKLNTGATINMKGEDLQKMNNSNAMSSLQGISPGVSITTESGAPGAGTKVNIRGIGTIGNSKPLYVVDGVQVSDIDYLSPSDIESIDVLKDAASSAIYGSQAANGVILVTTRKGKKGQGVIIAYDNYFGVKNVAKDPDMLDAKTYMAAQNEANMNITGIETDYSSIPNYDAIMAGTNSGTDWFGEMVNENTFVQNHALNVTGSSEKSTYAMGFSYMSDEGLLGKQAKSNYQRITARINSEHILKTWNDLDVLVFGENLTFTNTDNPNVANDGIYSNDVHNHIVANPLLPMYDENGDYTDNIDIDPKSLNPTALMVYQRKHNENNSNKIVGNAYLEIQPIKHLKIRSSYGVDNWYGSSRSWVQSYDLNTLNKQDYDIVEQVSNMGYKWLWTNTISYYLELKTSHKINVVLGQEAQKNERQLELSARNQNSTYQDWEYAYLWNVPLSDLSYLNYPDEKTGRIPGRDLKGWAMNSYFSRLSYDYLEKYMLTYVFRRDGSTNFGSNNRYANFHSVSAGWILTQEDFMSNLPVVNYLKLRGSWGQNGNQEIPAFRYSANIIREGSDYPFGPDKLNNTIGSQLENLPNPDIKWETSEQTNIGLDAHFANSRLQASFDWYNKVTEDWLLLAPTLATDGTSAPWINGGKVINKGIELSLKWSDQVGDFKYSVTGTMAYNNNEVTEIDNAEKLIYGENGKNVLGQGMSELYRAEPGYAIGYFWGYETAGILKTDAEVQAYIAELATNADAFASGTEDNPVYDSKFTDKNLAPGEARFVDTNGDGLINDKDKVQIGDPNPDYTFGLQLSLEYKNAYLQFVGVGKAGHQVAMAYHSYTDNFTQNMDSYSYENAFHETRNPDGELARLSTSNFTMKQVNDLYIHDADYFRISNITIGYNFKDALGSKIFKDFRLYGTVQNLATFTKYPGMDPEVGYGPDSWASGIDLGLYPLARTYMIGLSVKF